jgi:hypothetical protein
MLEPLNHTAHSWKWRQPARALAGLIVASAAFAGAATAVATQRQTAHVSRAINGNATAHLHLVKAEGSELIEEGPVSGALAGSAHAELRTGATFTASYTIHTQAGSISGRGQATPHGSGRYQSFAGTFSTSGGTGRYTHVSGHARLSGVFDRRTDAVVIQTSGTLSY